MKTEATAGEFRDDLTRPLAPARVSPPVAPRNAVLPFLDEEFTWQHFQRLCVEVARNADGYVEVLQYGYAGQKQYGLDLLASGVGRDKSVYQARRVKKLTAADLVEAVEDYATGERRRLANRFVLCVACPARDTHVIDQLNTLRSAYPKLQIDIYDDARLSELLRRLPDVVRTHFGDDWTRAFCLAVESPPPLDPEALLRGPVQALGLGGAVADATAAETSDPSLAAETYERIAERLAPRYPLQASTFREKAAGVLARGGEWTAAFDRWFELALHEVWSHAEPRMSPSTRTGLIESTKHVDEVRVLRYRVLDAWQTWHEAPDVRRALAEAFDELNRRRDIFADRAAVMFTESHLVDLDLEPIRQRRDELLALCGDLSSSERIRLRVAIADVDGAASWESLYSEATNRDLPLRDAAYVAIRAGRWYAWSGENGRAETAYRRAVELAAEAALDLDATNALWGLTALYAQTRHYDRLWSANEMARTIQGTRSYVPQHPHTREHALRALADPRGGPEAHMWLRHQLWESLIGASLAAEIETLSDLGRLYGSAGFPLDAIRSYVRAGEHEAATKIIREGSQWVDLIPEAKSATPWQRRAAFRTLAAEGNLVPDDRLPELTPLLLVALEGEDTEAAAAAAELAGSVTYQMSLDDARLLAGALTPYAQREPGHYRHTDKGLLRFAGRSYEVHPELRDMLADLIAACASGEIADSQLEQAVARCAENPAPLIARLTPQADAGNAAAISLLAMLNVRHPAVLEQERRRFATIMETETGRVRGEHKIGLDFSLPATFLGELEPALRARYLEKLVEIAADGNDIIPNRADALIALAQAVSVHPSDEHARHFTLVFHLTQTVTVSPIEEWQQQTNHALSRFRLNFGSPDELRGAALIAAAVLASTVEQRQQVADSAFELLRFPGAVQAAARVIVTLNEKGTKIDPALLAAAPHVPLRQAAVAIWCADPRPADLGKRLAADAAFEVRSQLAGGLRLLGRTDPSLESDLRTKLSADPSARVRWIARSRMGDND